MLLRDYQQALVDEVRAAFNSGARSVTMQLGTGGGKTATAAEIIRLAVSKRYRVVFGAHLDALIDDTSERLQRAGIFHGIVQAGRPSSPLATVQVASLATLHRRGERPPADLLILDECFPAGTLVDGRPIELYRAGDTVWSYDHQRGRAVRRRVTFVWRRESTAMIRIHLRDGRHVDCTPSHPFFSGDAYVRAAELRPGAPLLQLRPAVAAGHEEQARLLQANREDVLLSRMREGSAPSICQGSRHAYPVDAQECLHPSEYRSAYVCDSSEPAKPSRLRKLLNG